MAQNLSSEEVPPTQGPAVSTTPDTPFSPLTPQRGNEQQDDEDESEEAFSQLSLEDQIKALRMRIAVNAARAQAAERAAQNFINSLVAAQRQKDAQEAKLKDHARQISDNSARLDYQSTVNSEMSNDIDHEAEERRKTNRQVAELKETVEDLNNQIQAEQPISIAQDPADVSQRLMISNVRALRHSNEIARDFVENVVPLIKEVVSHFKSNSGQLSTVVTTPNAQRGNHDPKTQQSGGQRYLAYKDTLALKYTENNRVSTDESIEAQLLGLFTKRSMLIYGLGYYLFATYPGFLSQNPSFNKSYHAFVESFCTQYEEFLTRKDESDIAYEFVTETTVRTVYREGVQYFLDGLDVLHRGFPPTPTLDITKATFQEAAWYSEGNFQEACFNIAHVVKRFITPLNPNASMSFIQELEPLTKGTLTGSMALHLMIRKVTAWLPITADRTAVVQAQVVFRAVNSFTRDRDDVLQMLDYAIYQVDESQKLNCRQDRKLSEQTVYALVESRLQQQYPPGAMNDNDVSVFNQLIAKILHAKEFPQAHPPITATFTQYNDLRSMYRMFDAAGTSIQHPKNSMTRNPKYVKRSPSEMVRYNHKSGATEVNEGTNRSAHQNMNTAGNAGNDETPYDEDAHLADGSQSFENDSDAWSVLPSEQDPVDKVICALSNGEQPYIAATLNGGDDPPSDHETPSDNEYTEQETQMLNTFYSSDEEDPSDEIASAMAQLKGKPKPKTRANKRSDLRNASSWTPDPPNAGKRDNTRPFNARDRGPSSKPPRQFSPRPTTPRPGMGLSPPTQQHPGKGAPPPRGPTRQSGQRDARDTPRRFTGQPRQSGIPPLEASKAALDKVLSAKIRRIMEFLEKPCPAGKDETHWYKFKAQMAKRSLIDILSRIEHKLHRNLRPQAYRTLNAHWTWHPQDSNGKIIMSEDDLATLFE